MTHGKTEPVMYVGGMDVFLNRWFTTYDTARASLEKEGGFLFPCAGHFFVTVPDGVRELGLDPADPDWERIGRDWVRPTEREAWERLVVKRWISA